MCADDIFFHIILILTMCADDIFFHIILILTVCADDERQWKELASLWINTINFYYFLCWTLNAVFYFLFAECVE